MTPTWAVILVGLVGGALGALATTLLTISHERAAEFRSHLLNAADEFSTATIVALQKTRDAAGEIGNASGPLVGARGLFLPEIKAQLDAANAAVDDVFAKQARVHLLFGDPSPATLASIGATAHLRNMLIALEHRPDSIRDHAAMLTYSRNFSGAQEQNEKFNLAALVALQETWLDRLRGRWQLRRRAKKAAKA
jgi:hypothetical protein